MTNYNPETMIPVNEAKEYAMKRRFEVKPEERIHVCRYTCEADKHFPYVYREIHKGDCGVLSFEEEIRLLESFTAWDKDAINNIGDKGAARLVFDREAFFNLFSDYPQK